MSRKPKLLVLPTVLSSIIVTKLANQSIPHNVVTQVALDNLVAINGADFTFRPATNDILVTTPGQYVVGAHLQWSTNLNHSRAIQIFRNGFVFIIQSAIAANQTNALHGLTASGLVNLSVNDVIDLRVYQGSGVTLNLVAMTGYMPALTLIKVG